MIQVLFTISVLILFIIILLITVLYYKHQLWWWICPFIFYFYHFICAFQTYFKMDEMSFSHFSFVTCFFLSHQRKHHLMSWRFNDLLRKVFFPHWTALAPHRNQKIINVKGLFLDSQFYSISLYVYPKGSITLAWLV